MLTNFTRLPLARAFTIAMIIAMLFVLPALAQDSTPPASPLQPYLDLAATLGGFAVLFSVLINAAKYFHFIADGDAGIVSVVLNVGLLIIVIISQAFGLDLAKFDTLAGTVAGMLTTVLSLFGQLVVTRLTYAGLKRLPVPVLNASFSKA